MQPQEARHTLRSIETLRTTTREQLHPNWFPNILWGTVVLIGGPIADIAGNWVALYWAIVAPVGALATALFFHRREERLGLRDNPLPWFVLSAMLIAGTFAAGAFLPGNPEGVGPALVASAGVTAFGLLAQHRATAILGMVAACWCIAVIFLDPPASNTLMALVLGGGGVLLGLRDLQRASRQGSVW